MSLVSLCGSHRTGKSTLAAEFAKESGITFLETSVSKIIRDKGYNPSQAAYDFSTRLDIQEHVLTELDKLYGCLNPLEHAIADRSPLDALAYTMSVAIGEEVPDSEQDRFSRYVQRCFEVTNRRFSSLILVQPGIPIIAADGKAAANEAYMEHLNSLILGLMVDVRCEVPHFFIGRGVLNIESRVRAVRVAVNKSCRLGVSQLTQHIEEGNFLH